MKRSIKAFINIIAECSTSTLTGSQGGKWNNLTVNSSNQDVAVQKLREHTFCKAFLMCGISFQLPFTCCSLSKHMTRASGHKR